MKSERFEITTCDKCHCESVELFNSSKSRLLCLKCFSEYESQREERERNETRQRIKAGWREQDEGIEAEQ